MREYVLVVNHSDKKFYFLDREDLSRTEWEKILKAHNGNESEVNWLKRFLEVETPLNMEQIVTLKGLLEIDIVSI